MPNLTLMFVYSILNAQQFKSKQKVQLLGFVQNQIRKSFVNIEHLEYPGLGGSISTFF